MFPEARIDIGLRTAHGRVAGVSVASTRIVQAARVFSGRRPEEVTALLPSVFSLCGAAQRAACADAVEAARSQVPSPGQLTLRRVDVLAETVAEHGLAVIRDWAALAGEPADLTPGKSLRVAMAAIRSTPAQAVARASEIMAEVLGAAPGAVLAGAEPFSAWLARGGTPAARLLRGIVDEGLAGFGAGPFIPMPATGPVDLAERMADDVDGRYAAAPDCGGKVYETGPLARHRHHPLVAALMAEHGTGILPRMAARLVDLAAALRELELLVQDLPEEPSPRPSDGAGTGLGLVEAARGLLAHRVELEDGRVKSYRILAPTEWNFHPAGPLAAGLMGAAAGDDLERRARLLVHALDPCVACSVAVE
ncbi:MAG: nickel-dependent hydrogenase large subunit [Pseudomonadota bacterium]